MFLYMYTSQIVLILVGDILSSNGFNSIQNNFFEYWKLLAIINGLYLGSFEWHFIWAMTYLSFCYRWWGFPQISDLCLYPKLSWQNLQKATTWFANTSQEASLLSNRQYCLMGSSWIWCLVLQTPKPSLMAQIDQTGWNVLLHSTQAVCLLFVCLERCSCFLCTARLFLSDASGRGYSWSRYSYSKLEMLCFWFRLKQFFIWYQLWCWWCLGEKSCQLFCL